MAKGFARPGIIFTSLIAANGAGAATVADLLTSEITVNPAAVSNTRGEWFELYNPTADEINLRGITVGDDGRDSHRIETDLLIMPRHFMTLARHGDSASNGVFVADYVYDGFILGNPGDEIVRRDDSAKLPRLEYGADFGTVGQPGELIALPMGAANYGLTLAEFTYGLGDTGKPGAAANVVLGPSAVSLPASEWMFVTDVFAWLKTFTIRIRIAHRHAEALHSRQAKAPRSGRRVPA